MVLNQHCSHARLFWAAPSDGLNAALPCAGHVVIAIVSLAFCLPAAKPGDHFYFQYPSTCHTRTSIILHMKPTYPVL